MRFPRLDHDGIRFDPRDPPHQHAPMPRRSAFDHLLMVRPGNKVRTEAARVHLFQLKFFRAADWMLTPRPCVVNRFSIGLRGERDILGIFIAAFDFQG